MQQVKTQKSLLDLVIFCRTYAMRLSQVNNSYIPDNKKSTKGKEKHIVQNTKKCNPLEPEQDRGVTGLCTKDQYSCSSKNQRKNERITC